ncbi:MAG: hypothetical protein SVU94_02105 [Bacteroidota bacterium]|nr:hypothetical protein [Bacteroidota bacterium]
MALARFILILFIIFFLIRVVTRFILKKYVKNMQNQYKDSHHQTQQKKEGDVTIKSSSKQNKKIDDDIGDYIDYEEVKDD